MSSLTNKYLNNRSMNGLINIYADSVETTNSVVNDTLIVDGKDISLTMDQVETNKNNLTGITYTATPTPTTKIVNDIDETGTIYIRDPSNPSVVYMRINYESSLYGFCFTDETPGRIMNFRVKNANGIGYKLFYFASSQLYASMLTYIDNWLTVSYNNQFVLGDANNIGVWGGSSIKYIPNTATTSGLVFYNKGLNNNTVYYTNFTHNDPFNVQLYTFRMNYANIWSKVKHTFENGIDITGGTVSGNVNMSGALDVSGITNLQKTYINGDFTTYFFSYFNKDISLNSTTKIIVNGTTGITQNELSYLSDTTSNIQTQLNNKFNLTGGTVSGNVNITGTLDIGGVSNLQRANINDVLVCYSYSNYFNHLIFEPGTNLYVNGTGLTQTELACISGITSNIQTQLNTKPSLSGANTYSGTNTFPSISFTNGTTQTTAFNSTTCGYTISGTTLTFPTNTILNCAVGGIGNEIKCHKFNCYNIIEFPDGSIQNTGYTLADNTKLQAIGTTTTSTLTVTTTLTSGSFFNCGSMSLVAGTYILTLNCCLAVITGSTTVSQLLMGLSTSSTGLSANSNLSIIHGGVITYQVGAQWVLTTSAIVSPTATTTYYMVCQASFGAVSRMQFANGNSGFKAVRIA